jgi:hypothetical protein
MADTLIFYHICKDPSIIMDVSLWFDPQIQLKIVADFEPNTVIHKQAPHIHWMTLEEFGQLKIKYSEEKIFMGLPSLFHVPLFLEENVAIPKGYGVMVPVFDFDWVYYIKSDKEEQQIIRYSQHQIRIDNKMTSRQEWITHHIRPSWDMFHENVNTLDVYQLRMLVGLSKILGEWRVVADISPRCGWSDAIVQYDQAQVDFHTSMRLPLKERQQQLFGTLEKSEYWYETWWMLLEYADMGFDVSCIQTRLKFKAILNNCHQTQKDFPEWCEDMPLFRWVPKKIIDEDTLFHSEVSLLKKTMDEFTPFWRRHLFAKALRLQDATSHHTFIQESLGFLPRLCDMEGCEKGDMLCLDDNVDFVPSSSGLIVYPDNPRWYLVNVRKVNYRIMPNGSYITMKQGAFSPTYNGISKNECFLMDRETLQPVSPVRPMKEDIPGHRDEEIAIVGLEDVRLVPGINQDVLFYGVTKSYSYSDAIRVITGKYDVERCLFHSTRVIHPPYEENACEKNWTWCGNNRFIYQWNPVEIGSVDANDRLVVDERIASPSYFKQFRGSSPAVLWKTYHWFSVHSVGHGTNGRKYMHSIVVLDLQSEKHKVVAVSAPFCFEDVQIEYTIGLDIYKGRLVFLYSTRDSTSKYMRIPLCHILETLLFFDKQHEMEFKTNILQEFF